MVVALRNEGYSTGTYMRKTLALEPPPVIGVVRRVTSYKPLFPPLRS